MKSRMLSSLGAWTLLVLGPIAIASATCYQQKWFASTIKCTGGCGGQYDICPGRVLCDVVPVGKKIPGTIVISPVACQTYLGGTGTCPNCAGGTLQIPPTNFVTVANQTCTQVCP